MTFDIGDKIKLVAAFTSRKLTTAEAKTFREEGTLPAEVGVDPTTVKCNVKNPADVVSEKEATGEDGIYTATVEPDKPGTWHYAFDGTGAYVSSGEGSFTVRERKVPR